MHVLMVTSTHPPKDVRIYHKEALSLVDAGYELSILILFNGTLPPDEKNVRFIRLKKNTNRFIMFFSLPRLLFKTLGIKADFYQLHDGHILFFIPFIKIFHPKARVIYDSHEPLPEYYFSKGWVPNCLRGTMKLAVRFYEWLFTMFCDGIIACFPAVIDRFKKRYFKTALVRNFPFLPDSNAAGLIKENLIVYVGLLSKKRMIDIMVSGSAMLDNTPALDGYRIEIYGAVSPEENYEEFSDFLTHIDTPRCKVHIGQIPLPEALGHISRAKFGLFFASKDFVSARYTLATKIFDYMIHGTVPVVTSMPTTTDYITDGSNGIVIPEGDEIKYIQYIADNIDKFDEMSYNATTIAREKYNWDSESKALIDFYAELKEK